jgi:hypothetical protein
MIPHQAIYLLTYEEFSIPLFYQVELFLSIYVGCKYNLLFFRSLIQFEMELF